MWFLKNAVNDNFIIVKQKLKLATGLMSKLFFGSNYFTSH